MFISSVGHDWRSFSTIAPEQPFGGRGNPAGRPFVEPAWTSAIPNSQTTSFRLDPWGLTSPPARSLSARHHLAAVRLATA
jgi:hypothetical protein